MIAPSILSADFSRMGQDVDEINQSGAHWLHVDIMDGNFVPPITFGHKMVKDLRSHSSLPFDVHLMVDHPDQHIQDFINAGADYITFHLEAVHHSHRLLGQIKDLGAKAGISIVPSTPVEWLLPLLDQVDLVLVMTVNPGFGGQSLIPSSLEKVNILRGYRKEKNLDFLISIDGGASLETLPQIEKAGPDVIVTGSAFFKASNRAQFIKKMAGN